MKTIVEVEVSKEGYELVSGLSKFIAAAKKEVEDNDGFSLIDDIAGITAAFGEFVLPALTGVTEIGKEIEEDKTAFAKGVALGITELVEVFIPEKKEAEIKAAE